MHEPVHSREQLHEGAERLQPDDLALDPCAFLDLRPRRVPGVLLERAQGQRDPVVALLVSNAPACGLLLDAQHLDAHLLAGLHHVLRMRDALVRQLGDVHQAFQAAQVDEGAEITHRADGSFQHRPDLELLAQLRGKPGPLLLQQRAPREDGVPAADLHHPELELLADELRGVLDEAHVDLRGGNEGAQASQVHLEAALVLRGDRTLDRHPRLERLLEHLAAGPLGHRAGHHRRAVREGEHVGVDGLALLHQKLALVVAQLAQVDDRLALPAQVEVSDLGAQVRDAHLDLLAEPQLLRLVRRLLALREEGAKVRGLVRRRFGES